MKFDTGLHQIIHSSYPPYIKVLFDVLQSEWQEISKKKKAPMSNKSSDTVFSQDSGVGGKGQQDGGRGGGEFEGESGDRMDSVTHGGGRRDDRGAPPRFQQQRGKWNCWLLTVTLYL